MLLIFHHMFRTVENIQRIEGASLLFSDDAVSHIAFCFRICVFMFCFISAYGMSLQLKKWKPDLLFFVYRSWRLLAPYWFTLTVLIICASLFQRRFLPASYDGNLLMMLGDYIPVLDIAGHTTNMLSGVFWYMNFTIMLIAVLPFIYKLTVKFGGLVICSTILLFNFIPSVVSSPYGGAYNNYLFAVELGIIFAINDGFAVIKKIFEKLNVFLKTLCAAILIFLSGCCPYLAWFKLNSNPMGIIPMLHTTGAISLIIFIYLFTSKKFIAKPLEFLGKYSFDAFLIHVIVFTNLSFILVKLHYIALQYVFAVICIMVISYILYLMKKYTGWATLISNVSDKIMDFKQTGC